jgi:hypothetical protein
MRDIVPLLNYGSIGSLIFASTLARMFHEGGSVSHVFAKRINLPGTLFGIGAQGQFAPVHFQEKCAVTA